ncbi:MAG: hypothetical protein K2O88_04090, partial [Paramuribaculum sp.]|nr:hypothetical protein [Paramuribaculum sp.]
MDRKLKIASVIAMTFLSCTDASGAATTKTPDFAFPKKVSQESLTTLKKAVASNDSPIIVRSILDYSLAQSAIGEEKVPNALEVINNTVSDSKDTVTKALLYLVKAKILCDLYVNDKYTYNERNLPLTPLPNNYKEWSGKQFQHVISQLCDSAIQPTKELQGIELRKYYSIVEHDNQTPIYFPSLYDFVAYQTIAIRSELTNFANLFGMAYLTPAKLFVYEPIFVPMSSEATKILSTYADLLKFHSGQSAPYIFADLQRLGFVKNGTYNSIDYNKRQEQFLSSLADLYQQQLQSEYSGDILIEYSDNINTSYIDTNTYWLYNQVKHNIAAFPSYSNIKCLNHIIDKLTHKSLNIWHNICVYPGKEFEVRIENKNTETYSVSLYRLPSKFQHSGVYKGTLSNLQKIDTKSITANKELPFNIEQKVSFVAPEPGYYIIAPSSTQIKPRNSREEYRILHCSRLAAGNLQLGKSSIFVVDPMTGAPTKDVSLMQYTRDNKLSKLGLSDQNGFLTIDSNKPIYVYPQKGTDVYAQSVYTWSSNNNDAYSDSTISAFTELPLYHPGDTLRFSAIAYSTIGQQHKALSNNTLTASLFDANNQFITSLQLTTDEFGRVNGNFTLPESGLTGYYSVAFCFGKHELKKYWGQKNGSIRFMVSDYKLPTFEVTANKPLTNIPDKGDVTLRGKLTTYSGMPLANQEVKLNLSVAQSYWWRMSNTVSFFTDSVTTDSNGNWEIVIKNNVLDNSPAPNGFFSANISSTSSSGETQQTDVSFTRTAKYQINSSVNSDYDVSCQVNINAQVINSANEIMDFPVLYELMLNDTVLQKGTVQPNMNWKHLSGRQYDLKLYIEQDTSVTTTSSVVLYSPSDKKSPVEDPIWMPSTNGDVITDSNKAKLLYGTYADNTYMLLVVSTSENIIEQRWIKSPRGMHTLEIKLPDTVDKVNVDIIATVNMKTSQIKRTVVRKSSLKSLKITTETFRNKIIPGSTETWTFRTTGINGSGEQTAMILNLYNSALNALQSPTWNFTPRIGFTRQLEISSPNIHGSLYTNIENQLRNNQCLYIQTPRFNLYSRSFMTVDQIINGFSPVSRNYKKALMGSTPIVMESAAVTEKEAADEAFNMVEDKATGLDTSDAGDATKHNENTSNEFAYRESNVVCGVWMPSLTTDKDGFVSVSFTVPNANTTWQLFATAFNHELTNATMSEQVIANKPVMVQPNLPRYLRTGDKAVVKSLVMNNSDSVAEITTTVEIFNPITNVVLAKHSETLSILPQQNSTVSIAVSAPMNQSMIGFRVKSSANGFADGEQSIIPVLPASQPVIETTPFYIAPDSSSHSIKIPTLPEDARITLQYCDNPLWYVVTALPGLAEQQPQSAINAAYNIFSASVAKGILKQNPEIAKALKYWSSSECSDSTLVSMLERNADLKTVLLNATPWLTDAQNDTQRMTRLALLLDNKNIDATILSGVKYLNKVKRPGGGLAWMNQCIEPSTWATSEVLACLGRVNQLGFMPNNNELESIINDALGYLQTVTEKTYAKYPKSDYFGYVSTLDLWPNFKRSAKSSEITSITLQRTVKDWRKFTVGHKAEAVILLMNHNYKKVASTILASLREYSEYKPQNGMWWPSVGDIYGGTMAQLQITADALEAFHTAEPTSQDVDRIRQWLILQKEAENWGSSAFTTDVISSILLTSKSWIQPALPLSMTLNGNTLNLPDADKFTGYFRSSIPAAQASNTTLTVNRQGNTPAFGALFYQFTQDMANIKAQECDAVRIEKRYFKHQQTGVTTTDSLKIGDKIQVTLTIHVNRDMQYVAITDNRPACFEPVEQMPKPLYSDGICFYRENRDSSTNLFVTNLPKGTYQLTYDMWVNNAGTFASGIATLQSQYAPQLTAHSEG